MATAAPSPVLEHRPHDHRRCSADALAHAERLCRDAGLRFTEQRRRVLAALLESHVPAGAYEVIDRLAEDGLRIAPVSVYRALDFLVEAGLAHRIESKNAYVACSRGPNCAGASAFLICENCGSAGEMASEQLGGFLAEMTDEAGFVPAARIVEIRGLCARCREDRG